uniref:Uncharacterized protein n=1 Tax=Arundo donax TaxID=35708 RepID=A0A0A8YD78_ARUDO
MKLMRFGCCLSLHEVLIMHTPRPTNPDGSPPPDAIPYR